MKSNASVGLWLAGIITAIMAILLLAASCGGPAIYEVDCGDPFNYCVEDSLSLK